MPNETLNPLQTYLDLHRLDETYALNVLQDAGVISDLCVWAKDVATVDCWKAVQYLKTVKATLPPRSGRL